MGKKRYTSCAQLFSRQAFQVTYNGKLGHPPITSLEPLIQGKAASNAQVLNTDRQVHRLSSSVKATMENLLELWLTSLVVAKNRRNPSAQRELV